MTQSFDDDYFSEDYINRIGDFLEHQGFDDEGIDEYFLEHFGVKGMRWGVRRRERIQRTINVGKGKKGAFDKARVFTKTNPIDLVRTGSFRKSAARKGHRMDIRNARLATKGRGKVRDYLAEIGTQRVTDVLPTFAPGKIKRDDRSKRAKINSGKAFVIALPVAVYWGISKVQKFRKGRANIM